ncbi:MAG: hypothetical protein AUH25_03285 [Thaumarchaeota archaeon 13_1_40CM_38_12]|nr:MAG: hypothetical protein AUH25_03285 [Thaumarchaeota archaeon 13_1_40CM_38_12]OLD41377.1 MAG: hypothetical protein AUI60_01805 [Thaumarchaeota archaeon 13_1_40CM_2_39_4]
MAKIFVCFVGIDGSGKSTLATNIFEKIRIKNKKTKKTYGRYQPIIGKCLMAVGRKLFLRNTNMFLNYDKYLDDKRHIFKKTSALARLYISSIIVEYYFEMIFKIIIPRKLGYSIISDRYVYDTVINDIAVDMNFSIKNVNELLQKFWTFIPKPDITFYLQVPEVVAKKRKDDIPSLNYLKIRNELYKELTTYEKIVVLDGTLDLLELERWVYSEIEKVL